MKGRFFKKLAATAIKAERIAREAGISVRENKNRERHLTKRYYVEAGRTQVLALSDVP